MKFFTSITLLFVGPFLCFTSCSSEGSNDYTAPKSRAEKVQESVNDALETMEENERRHREYILRRDSLKEADSLNGNTSTDGQYSFDKITPIALD